MEEVTTELIDKLPGWYLMAAIPALIIVLLWYVLPRVRRDKQGKLYWHSAQFESVKQTEKLDQIIHKMNGFDLDICKLIAYAENMPLAERIAGGLRYIKSGGNGECKKYVEGYLQSQSPDLYSGIQEIINDKH